MRRIYRIILSWHTADAAHRTSYDVAADTREAAIETARDVHVSAYGALIVGRVRRISARALPVAVVAPSAEASGTRARTDIGDTLARLSLAIARAARQGRAS